MSEKFLVILLWTALPSIVPLSPALDSFKEIWGTFGSNFLKLVKKNFVDGSYFRNILEKLVKLPVEVLEKPLAQYNGEKSFGRRENIIVKEFLKCKRLLKMFFTIFSNFLTIA